MNEIKFSQKEIDNIFHTTRGQNVKVEKRYLGILGMTSDSIKFNLKGKQVDIDRTFYTNWTMYKIYMRDDVLFAKGESSSIHEDSWKDIDRIFESLMEGHKNVPEYNVHKFHKLLEEE